MNDTDQSLNAKEALQKIKEAEMKAAAIIAAAREDEGPRLIQAAYEESRRMKESLLERARNEADALMRSLVEEARKEAERIAKDTDEERIRMRSRAASLMDRAVQETERRLAEFMKGGSV